MTKQLSFHIPEPLEGVEIHPSFHFLYPPQASTSLFQEGVPRSYFASVPRVGIEAADIVILPNNFKYTDERVRAYIQSHTDDAEKHSLPVFIFACGDFTEHLEFDSRVRIFRYSLYASTRKSQDICMPTVTPDLGRGQVVFRGKYDRPLVSFCGKAGFPTKRSWALYYIKNALGDMQGLVSRTARARKIGVYWRRRMMSACRRSSLVVTNFIIRRTFSGNRTTIELDPVQARREFIDSILTSDFVLAPKGDGNYSNRFLEALSFGRIPVVVDTDIVLPLEDQIAYERCVVRIPMNEVDRTPEYIRSWYEAHDEKAWIEAQDYARTVYERYLRVDTFFPRFFEKGPPPSRA